MADDDGEVMQRLAALEAEVKADADAQQARKDAALVRLREQRAAKQVEVEHERERRPQSRRDDADNLRGAIELAGQANRVKHELAKKGPKSWMASGVASLALGPLGWLYAGSLRETVPASAMWLVVVFVLSKIALPSLLLMPALLIGLPLSGIAGVVYALRYNKTGKRQRLFTGPTRKQLPASK